MDAASLRRLVLPLACCLPSPLIFLLFNDVGDDYLLYFIGLFLLFAVAIPSHLLGVFLSARLVRYALRRPRDYRAAGICLLPMLFNLAALLVWGRLFDFF
jgi:hypothetical protein